MHTIARETSQSLTLLLARASALAVAQHPLFNTAYTSDGLAHRQRIDIGLAMDTGDSLVTPVLRDAAERPLTELAEDWRILEEKTRRKRLVPADYRGATFYLSNLGMFPEVVAFNAIVPLGASAILAVAAAQPAGTMFTVTCDHRVIFGADAARFLATLNGLISQPQQWAKPADE